MALHGSVGEDGMLQDLLDASAVPYVGSRGDASRLANNKPIAKSLAERYGISNSYVESTHGMLQVNWP